MVECIPVGPSIFLFVGELVHLSYNFHHIDFHDSFLTTVISTSGCVFSNYSAQLSPLYRRMALFLFSIFFFFLPGPVGAFVVSQIRKQFRQCIIMHAEEDSSICFPTPVFFGEGGIYPVFMSCIYSKQCKTEQ